MPASLVARLARCDWPGNVRQLRNVARQLVIESRGASVVGSARRSRSCCASRVNIANIADHPTHPGGLAGRGAGPAAAAAANHGAPRATRRPPIAAPPRSARPSCSTPACLPWEVKPGGGPARISRPSL